MVGQWVKEFLSTILSSILMDLLSLNILYVTNNKGKLLSNTNEMLYIIIPSASFYYDFICRLILLSLTRKTQA